MPQTTPLARPTFFNSVCAIWWRNFKVWRVQFWPAITSNIFQPLLYLFSFGFGLGAVFAQMGETHYLAYVLPGIVANAAFFTASFEASISAFSRFYLQKTYSAILAAPVKLVEVLLAEALWSASKATLSALAVLGVGLSLGAIPHVQMVLPVLLFTFLCCFVFACFGLMVMAYAHGFEFFSYFFTFWVTPAFLFCGVFFEVSRFPEWVQTVAWFIPMTHMIHIVRPLLLAPETLTLMTILLYTAYIISFGAISFLLAHRRLSRRLFDK